MNMRPGPFRRGVGGACDAASGVMVASRVGRRRSGERLVRQGRSAARRRVWMEGARAGLR